MKILILGALSEEIEGIGKEIKDVTEHKAGVFAYKEGKLSGVTVLLCVTGVGKANSAGAVSAILATVGDVGQVINVGVAGGIGENVARGDIVLGERTVHHDYDQTPDGLRKGQVQGFDSEYFEGDKHMLAAMSKALATANVNYKVGVIASGDQFIASDVTAARIRKEFGALACDFESAPIAQICALYGVPFLSARAISDNGGDGAVESFYTFLTKVTEATVKGIKAYAELCTQSE